MKHKTIVLSLLFFSSLSLLSQTTTSDSSAKVTETPTVIETPATETETREVTSEAPESTGAEQPAVMGSEEAAAPAPDTVAPVLSTDMTPNKPGDHTSATKNTALKKANTFYGQQAYAEAIPMYERARENDGSNKFILSNLAECYRLTNNTNGQLLCYGELIKNGDAVPLQELYYGQALVENGEAEKATPYFEKYAADSRGKNLAASLAKAKSYSRNADAYSVTPVEYNSPQNDLCAIKFYDAVVFVSARSKTEWISKNQGWTVGSFMKIYSTQKGEDGFDTPPVLFMGDLNSKFNDGPISFTKDYNTVYLTRNNTKKAERAKDGSYKVKILEATLDQNGFSMVKILPFNNVNYNYAHPSISQDGLTLFFASDMEGGKGGMDIYMSKKDSSGQWGTPVNLGDKVNTAGTEVFPFIATNGVLYFSSNGQDGLGGLDIYETKLLVDMPTRVYNMGEPVNSKNDDFGIFIGEDLKSGYISSNRKAGGMDDDIYALQILREIKRGKEVTLVVKDKTTGEPIPNVKLVINGDTALTNELGSYQTMAEEDVEYKIEALKDDYFKAEENVNTKTSLEDSFTKELTLEKDPKLFLRALVTDAKNNALLEGVTLKITDLATNTDFDLYTTNIEGDYFKFLYSNRIGDKLTLMIRLEKTGYLQRTVIFTQTVEKPGEINMNQSLNLKLGRIEIGMDLAKMIDLNPIYFDLGKSTINKDAAIELDKIVQVMNEYPNMFIELGSHTDCRSSAASNLKLSTARAKASAAYIVKKGINKLRIIGKGYGEAKLLNNCGCEGKVQSNCPEEEHTKNRRTEFLITRLK